MQLQIVDFPSDPAGEVYKVREEIQKCLQRACTSETGMKVFKEVVKFTLTKLKEADVELLEHIKVRDYVEPEPEAEVAPEEQADAETP
jgi:hypothetical protein